MKADVIVVGVGAMGSAACFALARKGLSVVGIEQYEPGHALGSSHGESRVIRKAYFEHPDYVPLLERSYHLWREIELISGQSLFVRTGIAYFVPPGGEIHSGLMLSAQSHRVTIESISLKDAQTQFSQFRIPDGTVGLFEADSGYLKVENCVRTMSHLSTRFGAKICPNEKVMAWSADDQGVEVRTDRTTYQARYLVLASGAWIGQMLGELSLPLQVTRKVMGWAPLKDLSTQSQESPCFFYELNDGIYYGFPPLEGGDGSIKFAKHSGGESISGPAQLDRNSDEKSVQELSDFASHFLIGIDPKLTRSAVCMYTSTPDSHFILDYHPDHSNVMIASCCSGHGFKFAPVIGEIIQEKLMTQVSRLDVGFLGIKRFSPLN